MAKRLLVRSGLLLGAVYYTRTIGVWGNQQQTEHLYKDIKNGVRPTWQELERKLPFEIPALPPKGEVRYLLKHYYNEGVKNTFRFIVMIPCYTGQVIKKTKETVTELVNKVLTPAPSSTSKPNQPEEECKQEKDEPKKKKK